MLVPGWRNFIFTVAELAEARVEKNRAKTKSGRGPFRSTMNLQKQTQVSRAKYGSRETSVRGNEKYPGNLAADRCSIL
jgi:hypothetical protein